MKPDSRATAPPLRLAPPLPRRLLLAMAASTLLFVVLSLHLQVALMANGIFDEALFVHHAESLIGGRWLGPYSDLTLAKGPGFSFFLALNNLLGVPVTLSLALLYSAACALMARVLYEILGRPWVSLLAFIAMQWHPAMLPGRVIRDDISGAEALLLLACFCRAAYVPERWRRRLAWGLLAGLFLAWFWMTREDAVWVLPGLALIALAQLWRLWPWPRELLRLVVPLLGTGLAAAAALAVLAAVNLEVYGAFVITDVKSPSFERALDLLQSVRVGQPVPHVPVPVRVRAALDEVSPSFASLEPYFTGPGRGWERPGCARYPETCGEIAGGWFIWALRDAVAYEGHYRSAQTADAFYRQLRIEVRAACAAGRLRCQRSFLPFMPAMRPDQWRALPATALALYRLASWHRGSQPLTIDPALRSIGEPGEVQAMDMLLRRPLRAPTAAETAAFTLGGWFYDKADGWIRLHCASPDGDTLISFPRAPSPDLVAAFHDPNAGSQRFVISIPSVDACVLEQESGVTFRIGNARLGVAPFGDGLIGIDALMPVYGPPSGRGAAALVARISGLYSWLVPIALWLALFVYLVSLARALWRNQRELFDPPLQLASALLLMLLARAAILILVDLSSFPAITALYWNACFPLTMLFIITALALPIRRGRRG